MFQSFPKYADFILYQDGATAHSSKPTETLLAIQKIQFIKSTSGPLNHLDSRNPLPPDLQIKVRTAENQWKRERQRRSDLDDLDEKKALNLHSDHDRDFTGRCGPRST